MRGAACALMVAAAAVAGLARAADTVVQWDAAEQYVGQDVVVEGRIMGVHCSQLSCLLAFDPTFNRFTAVVQAKDFGRLPPDQLDARYSGRKVRVRGTIVERERKPEILVADPEALKVVETKEERQQRATERIQAQERMLERLDEMLKRVETMVERLTATQDRLDAAIAELAERSELLMAAAAAPPPPVILQVPPGPAGPEPRPGWESMRTVKRGMAAGEVRRLIGEPMDVVAGGNGWTTWLYDGGRSVSFDRRGRAQSLVGFPGS